jgi:ElaA protein
VSLIIHRSRWSDIDPLVLHNLIRLRLDVFVVEQHCPYPELDGRDVEPSTEHVWTSDKVGPSAYVRVLMEDDGRVRVGRVCTRGDARGFGLAALLVTDVIARYGSAPMVLDAQTYLVGFYQRYGFQPEGPQFLEDGIPHRTMVRGPGRSSSLVGAGSSGQGSEATSSDS